MGEHRWGPEFRCINGGCAIIQHASQRGWWRRGRGRSKWERTPIPPCTGNQEPERCTHVHRVQLAHNPGQDVVGGLKTGQCERPALPRLVVCEYHAEPEAIRLLVLGLAAEIERLTSGG